MQCMGLQRNSFERFVLLVKKLYLYDKGECMKRLRPALTSDAIGARGA